MDLSFKLPLTSFVGKLCAQTKLTELERDTVLGMTGRTEHLAANDTFVWLGDKATSTCLVTEGLCGRVDMPGDERRQITALYIPGDMPDLYSVFQPDACSKLEALSSATIMRISHEQVCGVMREFPAIAEAFARYLISDAAITNEWLVNVGGRQAKESVAHLFCEMAVRLGKVTGEHFSFALPLSQLQLAEICGISVVHINRSMSALRHDGLMQMERGQIRIADWSGLKRIAGFDDLYLRASSLSRLAN